jgi:hypothetical protein
MAQTKICNQCNKSKPFSEYHKKSDSKDLLQPKCKICVKQINQNFREIKPTYQVDWQRANPTKWSEYVTEWAKKNVKADISRSAIYFITNPDNKIYVGHTQTAFSQRKSAHKVQWHDDKRTLPYLHKSFSTYGWENHKWEVIDMAGLDKETLITIEYTMANHFNKLGISLNKRLK